MSDKNDGVWTDAYKSGAVPAEYQWTDVARSFVCVCGEVGWVDTDDEDHEHVCKCGRVYRLTVAFEVKQP